MLSAFTPTSRSVTVNPQVFDVSSGHGPATSPRALAVAAIVLMYLGARRRKYFTASKAYRQQIAACADIVGASDPVRPGTDHAEVPVGSLS